MKAYIKTFGCACNKRDSENICGILLDEGFSIVDSIVDADIVIVNSCGVKTVTEHRVISFIESVPGGKRVFVGGCLTRMVDLKSLIPRIEAVFDVNSILSLPRAIGSSSDISSDEKEHRLNIPIRRSEKGVAFIPISQGCVGECSYCSVRFARGSLKSYHKGDILKEVREAVAEGCTRINLTAQDTGCYGLDIGETLPSLLKAVLAIEGDFIVRVGMMNPNFAKKYLDELVELFKSEKVLRFVHIPVQSGSDKVLKDMRRAYSVDDFREVVKRFRFEIPEIYFNTDIIVGYPSESEEDFQKTMALMDELRPDVVNISRFASRPGTPASGLGGLPALELKRRSTLLHDLLKNFS